MKQLKITDFEAAIAEFLGVPAPSVSSQIAKMSDDDDFMQDSNQEE